MSSATPNHSLNRPIAAGRHLGYKSLAQMPTHRNGPVSSNVRTHKPDGNSNTAADSKPLTTMRENQD